jgi:hypothetical protein
MSVTDPKEVSVVHDKVLNLDVGVLINFIFLVNCHSFPIAEGKFGDRVGCFFVLGFLVVS